MLLLLFGYMFLCPTPACFPVATVLCLIPLFLLLLLLFLLLLLLLLLSLLLLLFFLLLLLSFTLLCGWPFSVLLAAPLPSSPSLPLLYYSLLLPGLVSVLLFASHSSPVALLVLLLASLPCSCRAGWRLSSHPPLFP